MSRHQRLEVELEFLRDSCIRAARDRQLGVLKDGLDSYHQLVEVFLKELVAIDSVYSRELALREIHSIGQGWSEMEWIESNYRDILDAAFQTEDWATIDDVLFFPISLGTLALRYGDYYVYYRFLKWLPYAYSRARDMHESRVQSLVVDRCGRYLTEFMSWNLAPILAGAECEELSRTSDYIVGGQLIFQQLLKGALDAGNVDEFCQFARQLESSTDAALDSNYGRRSDSESDVRNEARATISRTRYLIALGVEAWMLHIYEGGGIDSGRAHDLRACLPSPATPSEVWSVYLDAVRHDRMHDFGWSAWELEEHPEGAFVGLAFDILLARVVALRFIERPPSPSDLLRDPPGSIIGYVRVDGALITFLRSIAQEPDPWQQIVDAQVLDRAQELSDVIESAANQDRATERQRLVEAPVSRVRLKAIADNIQQAWRDTATVRELFDRSGRITYLTETSPSDIRSFGVASWDFKELYVDVPSSFYTSDWGKDFGRSMGQGENQHVLKELISRAEHAATTNAPLHDFDRLLGDMRSDGLNPTIVVGGASMFLSELWRSKGFRAGEASFEDGTRALGKYSDAEVWNIYIPDFSGIVLADFDRMAAWEQYWPLELPEATNLVIGDALLFAVREFDADQARNLVRENPSMRNLAKDATSDDEVYLSIQARVHARVLEWFRVVVTEPQAVRLLALGEDP